METLAAAPEIDFSLLGLFLRATITVKLVMIGLLVMSFYSWAIIIRKHIMYRAARAEARSKDASLWPNLELRASQSVDRNTNGVETSLQLWSFIP